MVVEEVVMNSQNEVESRLQHEANRNNQSQFSPSSLGRQSSIYSLTLDEFQHSLCENGKNFGSMNMDEFLTSIWSAEENQAIITSSNVALSQTGTTTTAATTIRKQPSLPRQTSLSLPAPLCRKTVDEVWSQIQKEQNNNSTTITNNSNNNNNNNNNIQNTESAPRQPTFGEMTLEDFLVKAGVVREAGVQPQQQHYVNNVNNVGPSYVGRHVMGGGAVSNVVGAGYQVGEASGGYGVNVNVNVNGKRDSGYHVAGVGYGGGGYGMGMGMGGPVSPANSSDGIGNDNCGGQFGLDIVALRGRKRMVDGPVEKVVERRQRRMIKNRESAARSRARKQAYTVELEAELNQLKEENAQLKQALAELERIRKQQMQSFEEENVRVQTKAQKAKEKLRALRRNMSCPL